MILDPVVTLGTAGYVSEGYSEDVVLERYNDDGSLDVSFGDDGQVVTNLGQSSVFLTDMALEPDGNIVTAGFSYSGPINNPEGYGQIGPFLTLARFQNDSLPLVLPPGPPPAVPPPAAPPQAPDNPAQIQPAQDSVVPSNPSPVVASFSASVQALLGGSSQPLPAPATPSVPLSAVPIPPPVADPTVESGPTHTDPFGIHIVGGSNPVVPDSTGDPNVLSGPSPVTPVDEMTTDQAVLPPAPRATSFAVPTVVLDMLFQLMPLWTRAVPVAAPLPAAAAPLTTSSVPAVPTPPVVNDGHAAASQRWPALAIGAVLSLGLVAAETDRSRRRARRSDAVE